jgi:hypothetical protein
VRGGIANVNPRAVCWGGPSRKAAATDITQSQGWWIIQLAGEGRRSQPGCHTAKKSYNIEAPTGRHNHLSVPKSWNCLCLLISNAALWEAGKQHSFEVMTVTCCNVSFKMQPHPSAGAGSQATATIAADVDAKAGIWRTAPQASQYSSKLGDATGSAIGGERHAPAQ